MSEENTTESTEQAEAANAAGLNIGDLAGLRQIIAVAAQRGAFKAEEMEVVGRVYNKLNTFLNGLAPAEEAVAEESTEEEISSEE